MLSSIPEVLVYDPDVQRRQSEELVAPTKQHKLSFSDIPKQESLWFPKALDFLIISPLKINDPHVHRVST